MSSLEDSHSYEEYICYNLLGTSTTSLLIGAVVNNEIPILRKLLKSPELYNVCDKWGYSLLQISILCDSVEVFDYLLSLPDFPVNFVNRNQVTALRLSIDSSIRQQSWLREHFPYELIKKGAKLNDWFLMCAIQNLHFRVATLLIQKGVNVNRLYEECPPALEQAITMEPVHSELVMALLMSGARFSIYPFDYPIRNSLSNEIIDAIILLFFNEHSKVQISWKILISLADNNFRLFHELCRHPMEIIFFEDDDMHSFITDCLARRTHTLRLIVSKLDPELDQILPLLPTASLLSEWPLNLQRLRSLEILLNTNLREFVMDYIQNLNSERLPLVAPQSDTKIYCYLLSYGFILNESDLWRVYKRYGYCECFKIFLHMPASTERDPETWHIHGMWPLFIYHLDVKLEDLFEIDNCDLRRFARYFKNRELTRLVHCNRRHILNPNVNFVMDPPSLLELSRNVFRKYFIEFFQIQNSVRFHTLVNDLHIHDTFKKVITYERKLY